MAVHTRLIPLFRALLFVLAAHPGMQAQAPDIQWQRCLGGSAGEFCYRIQPAADGGYVLAGFTNSTDGDVTGNHGAQDLWMAKVDAAGSLQWQHCYGGTGIEIAYGLTAMADGGWALSGTTGSNDGDAADCPAGPGSHAWVLRTDAQGTLVWKACLGGSGLYAAGFSDAVPTADGGLMLAGGTSYTDGIGAGNHGGSDFLVVKLNASGMVEWSRCYGGSGSEGANAIKATEDGGYVVAGFFGGGTADGDVDTGTQGRIWVIKIQADGTLDWNRRMGGLWGQGQADLIGDIAQTPDGGYLVVGSSNATGGDVSGNHGDYDAWLVKLNVGGAIVQQRCFGGAETDYALRVAAAGSGRHVIVGLSASNNGDVSGNHGDGDVWAFMVDAELNLLWQKCLGGSMADYGYGIARTSDNSTILTGYTRSNDGDVSGNHGSLDAWVVKLEKDLDAGIVEASAYPGLTAHPSPASTMVNVLLPDALPPNASLDVVDISGRVIMHRQLGPSVSSLQIPVQAWADGVYCLRLDVGGSLRTARFVKQ